MRGLIGSALSPPELAWAESGLGSDATLPSACFATPPGRTNGALYRDGDLLLAADARIDDLASLRSALGPHAPPGPAAGPAAHIAAAWRRWGRDCPDRLVGDYAFVVHDASTGEVFCARDHIGARPLAYAIDGTRFAFASDPAELLGLPGQSAELDEAYVATALLRREFEPHRTFHRAIRKVPAGHYLHWRNGTAELVRWWRPEDIRIDPHTDDAEAITETARLLCLAVADRLAGAVRPAVHLSGGLDSGLVAALATVNQSKANRPLPLAYCWQPLDPAAEEAGWAQTVGSALGLVPQPIRLAPPELADLLLADWTVGGDARYLIHEEATQRAAEAAGVDTILSGWGGDEAVSFHGWDRDAELLRGGRWLTLAREATAPGLTARLAPFRSAFRLLSGWQEDPAAKARDLIGRGKSLIDPDFLRDHPPLPAPRIGRGSVQAAQIALLRHGSPTGRIEQWALSGSRRGLTYAYPLLDRRLLEWVLALPSRMFKRRGEGRWLAREVARGLLPEAIRVNSDKSEPARTALLKADLAAAYRLIAPRLDDPAAPLTRARYIDMAALRRQLDEIDRTGNSFGRGVRTAIQFLDFA